MTKPPLVICITPIAWIQFLTTSSLFNAKHLNHFGDYLKIFFYKGKIHPFLPAGLSVFFVLLAIGILTFPSIVWHSKIETQEQIKLLTNVGAVGAGFWMLSFCCLVVYLNPLFLLPVFMGAAFSVKYMAVKTQTNKAANKSQ